MLVGAPPTDQAGISQGKQQLQHCDLGPGVFAFYSWLQLPAACALFIIPGVRVPAQRVFNQVPYYYPEWGTPAQRLFYHVPYEYPLTGGTRTAALQSV